MENFENGYALLIGTGSDEKIRSATIGDAVQMQKVLLENTKYPSDQVQLLTGENATLEKIKEGFNWLAEKCGGLDGGSGKTALILYSGHGRNPNDFVKEFYLEPYGTQPDGKGGLPASLFLRQIDRILADKIIIILSCCHAAKLGVSLGEESVDDDTNQFFSEADDFVQKLEKGKGRIIISSSHASQESFAASEESETTIFGQVLIEGMRGKAARLTDKTVSALQISDYVLKNVEERVRTIGRSQKPI